jgi:GABA(A) receptor-associated protein
MIHYKQRVSFEKRKEESTRILDKYKERIPIIVSKCTRCDLPEIDKEKYLVPKDMSLGQFVYVIRKRIKLDPNQALFTLVNNTLQTSCKHIEEIYNKQKDQDGFLYIHYSSENTFG